MSLFLTVKTSSIVALSTVNSVAHFESYRQLQKKKDDAAGGVLVAGFVNAVLAYLAYIQVPWYIYPGITFPSVGATGLSVTKLVKGEGVAIDYFILAIDIITVCILGNELVVRNGSP